MKKSYNFLIQVGLLFVLLYAMSSCKNKNADPEAQAEKSNEAKFNNKAQEKDAEFLVKAAEINLEEIILGKLVQQKGGSSHVVALGKMMQEQHQKSLDELTALAKTKVITIPTTATNDINEAYTKLNKKTSGSEFDKAYADMMVEGHEGAIRLFESASTDCQDHDIKSWATSKLPELRVHLDHAIQCKKDCEKAYSSKM